ncbi:MAG: hypothetical protein ACOVKV_14230, partial [Novosphingobium sp.]
GLLQSLLGAAYRLDDLRVEPRHFAQRMQWQAGAKGMASGAVSDWGEFAGHDDGVTLFLPFGIPTPL